MRAPVSVRSMWHIKAARMKAWPSMRKALDDKSYANGSWKRVLLLSLLAFLFQFGVPRLPL